MQDALKTLTSSGFGEIQFHPDAIGIVEEDLGVAGARHDLLAEVDVFRRETLAHAVDVSRSEGDVVEAAGILVFLRGAPHHDAVARFAGAHQMYGGLAAGIKPVTGE